MVRIAICDDSVFDARFLETLCNDEHERYDMEIRSFTDAKEFLMDYQKNLYDIVFLDIEMPKLGGIEVGKELRKFNSQTILIFATGYPQYAIEGYDCEAFQYLLKPVSKEKLTETLSRAMNKLSLLHQYYCVKTQNTIHRCLISDIYFVEYCQKHIIYHLKDDRIETTGRFSDVVSELGKYGFYQVHQGYIVNFSKIKRIQGYDILLEDGSRVMISVRKKSAVLLAYAKYLEETL